jgi:hypothetical protein
MGMHIWAVPYMQYICRMYINGAVCMESACGTSNYMSDGMTLTLALMCPRIFQLTAMQFNAVNGHWCIFKGP